MSTFKFYGDADAWVEFMKAAMQVAVQDWPQGVPSADHPLFMRVATKLADMALAEWNARRLQRTPL